MEAKLEIIIMSLVLVISIFTGVVLPGSDRLPTGFNFNSRTVFDMYLATPWDYKSVLVEINSGTRYKKTDKIGARLQPMITGINSQLSHMVNGTDAIDRFGVKYFEADRCGRALAVVFFQTPFQQEEHVKMLKEKIMQLKTDRLFINSARLGKFQLDHPKDPPETTTPPTTLVPTAVKDGCPAIPTCGETSSPVPTEADSCKDPGQKPDILGYIFSFVGVIALAIVILLCVVFCLDREVLIDRLRRLPRCCRQREEGQRKKDEPDHSDENVSMLETSVVNSESYDVGAGASKAKKGSVTQAQDSEGTVPW